MSGACAVQMQEIHGTAEHEKTGLADNLSRRQRLVLFLFVIAVVTNGACRVKWSRAFDVSMSTRWKVTTLLRSRCRSTCMWSTAVLCYDDAAQCTRCQQRLSSLVKIPAASISVPVLTSGVDSINSDVSRPSFLLSV